MTPLTIDFIYNPLRRPDLEHYICLLNSKQELVFAIAINASTGKFKERSLFSNEQYERLHNLRQVRMLTADMLSDVLEKIKFQKTLEENNPEEKWRPIPDGVTYDDIIRTLENALTCKRVNADDPNCEIATDSYGGRKVARGKLASSTKRNATYKSTKQTRVVMTRGKDGKMKKIEVTVFTKNGKQYRRKKGADGKFRYVLLS